MTPLLLSACGGSNGGDTEDSGFRFDGGSRRADGGDASAAGLHDAAVPDAAAPWDAGELDGGSSSDAGAADDGGVSTSDRFLLEDDGSPLCQTNDCYGFIELRFDGRLRVDRFGEFPTTLHEAVISEEDLDEAIVVLTAPELVELLESEEPPCNVPTDLREQMTLELGGALYSNSTRACGEPPIGAARERMRALREQYLPE